MQSRNVDIATSIGADHVIDYTHLDFARLGQRFDLILAVNGHHSIFAYRRMLSQNGTYVAIGGLVPILQALLLGRPLSTLGRKRLSRLRRFEFNVAKNDA
jgi:NADPH:quinone reductase-like Zn-dependent oxidoreductase